MKCHTQRQSDCCCSLMQNHTQLRKNNYVQTIKHYMSNHDLKKKINVLIVTEILELYDDCNEPL